MEFSFSFLEPVHGGSIRGCVNPGLSVIQSLRLLKADETCYVAPLSERWVIMGCR
jgi:hypothetical protein